MLNHLVNTRDSSGGIEDAQRAWHAAGARETERPRGQGAKQGKVWIWKKGGRPHQRLGPVIPIGAQFGRLRAVVSDRENNAQQVCGRNPPPLQATVHQPKAQSRLFTSSCTTTKQSKKNGSWRSTVNTPNGGQRLYKAVKVPRRHASR